MSDVLRIRTYKGNTRNWPVQIRTPNQKTPPDLSVATSIIVEWENEDGEDQPVINVLPNLPGADWSTGLVMIPLRPSNFTAEEGTYTFSLTIFIGGQEITYDDGVVEVAERPGYDSP